MTAPRSTLVVPLGGLGEIGLNALLLESEADAVLVDCGLLFAPPGAGIDYSIPDFSYLRERREKLRAVFLTHGHDDHVGALPHLLREFPVPVFGTPLTLALAETRLEELHAPGKRLLERVSLGGWAEAGPFRARFLRVTHSVPDSAALALETPGGTILHTGDFKLDDSPVDGRRTDEEGLAAWGERGVDLLCCDSTNAHVPGRTPTESRVGRALRQILPGVGGRAWLVTFGSHAHRVQQAVEASQECGRCAALVGRSLAAAARAARRLGLLRVPPGALIPEAGLGRLPRCRQTVILPGSQGEPQSAFHRVAHGLDPRHRILPGDHVLLSARIIPGNEPAVHRLVNLCLHQGARVHWEEASGLHASGHGYAEDLARMLDLTRPRHLLPVHGEPRHLDAMARLAAGRGMPEGSVLRLENGSSLRLSGGWVESGPQVPSRAVPVERRPHLRARAVGPEP